MLGIRIPQDILPDERGFVHPGRIGMSVAPKSAWNLPNHRRPRGMGMGSSGRYDDRVYALGENALLDDKLKVRGDPDQPDRHAFIEPAFAVELSVYEADLADTRRDWRQMWP